MSVSKFTLEEQTTYLKLVLDSTVEGFYAVDTEGQTTVCNAAFLKMLGFSSAAEVIGRKLHCDIHHTHLDGTIYNVQDCPIYNAAKHGTGKHVPHELFFRTDGTSFPVEYRAEPIYQNDELKGAVCTFVDISERVQSAAQLKAIQEQLRLAQEAGGTGVFTIDIIADTLQGSPEFYRIYGVPPDVNLPAVIEDTCLPEDRHVLSTAAQRAAGDVNVNAEYRIRRPSDGELRWISRRAELIYNETGAPISMIGTALDITERKQAELSLQKNERHLNLIIESAQDFAIFSTDAAGKIISWNPGAEKIFGFKSVEIMGEFVGMVFTPEDRADHIPELEMITASEQGRANDERWHIRADGSRFFASGVMAPMLGENDEIIGFTKIARDVTAQKEAEHLLIQARENAEAANMAKSEFLANMSHEIRTPMNAIIGLSNILANSSPLSEQQKQFVKTLQLSADSLLSLINDLLDISKIEARTVDLEHIPFSLNQIAQEVISMMATRVREKNLTFTMDGENIARRLFVGDPSRLRQVILNLCSNAVKFTEHGNIHIAITSEPTHLLGVEKICIAITDTGIGIAPDKLTDIFDKFIQADSSISRKYGGTGLGLAIAKTLTEIMGGTINVKSTIGQGSTFTVRIDLPVADDHTLQNVIIPERSAVHSNQEVFRETQILLVEDYPGNILVATAYLDNFGYGYDVAMNGIEALEKFKTKGFHIVLMDVQMPGLNGFETTQLIREYEQQHNCQPAIIIGMTAHALLGDRERCLSAGMDDYISKPFNPNELEQKLQKIAEGYVRKPPAALVG